MDVSHGNDLDALLLECRAVRHKIALKLHPDVKQVSVGRRQKKLHRLGLVACEGNPKRHGAVDLERGARANPVHARRLADKNAAGNARRFRRVFVESGVVAQMVALAFKGGTLPLKRFNVAVKRPVPRFASVEKNDVVDIHVDFADRAGACERDALHAICARPRRQVNDEPPSRGARQPEADYLVEGAAGEGNRAAAPLHVVKPHVEGNAVKAREIGIDGESRLCALVGLRLPAARMKAQ